MLRGEIVLEYDLAAIVSRIRVVAVLPDGGVILKISNERADAEA